MAKRFLHDALLAFAPVPVVVVSFALCAWLRQEPAGPVVANEVLPLAGPQRLTRLEARELRPLVDPAVAPANYVEIDDADRRALKLAARCQALADRWESRLGEPCAVLVRPPFVLGGDLDLAELDAWHRRTVEPARLAMSQSYFDRGPDEPISILLFSGERAYNDYTERLFHEQGISIYGYYKPDERTLVMNIATGGGTLVHELTHALAAFDFPRMPDWFNEGLASLHEQCRFRNEQDRHWIEGLENWRLAGLQDVIDRGRLRTLESLVTSNDFRGKYEGANYAQARYLCLYLQRNGLLEDFYRDFRRSLPNDPTGLKTLAKYAPGESLSNLDGDFRDWVMTLERP